MGQSCTLNKKRIRGILAGVSFNVQVLPITDLRYRAVFSVAQKKVPKSEGEMSKEGFVLAKYLSCRETVHGSGYA